MASRNMLAAILGMLAVGGAGLFTDPKPKVRRPVSDLGGPQPSMKPRKSGLRSKQARNRTKADRRKEKSK